MAPGLRLAILHLLMWQQWHIYCPVKRYLHAQPILFFIQVSIPQNKYPATVVKHIEACYKLTSNVTGRHWDPKRKLRPALRFGVVLHVQHIFANSFNSLVTYRLRFSIPRAYFFVYGMTLYWPTLQFYVCVYVSFVVWYVAPPCECYYNALLCCDYFSSSSVVSHAFSALCGVYSKFWHHPHPLRHLCVKFRFFRGLHCWAGPWRKIA